MRKILSDSGYLGSSPHLLAPGSVLSYLCQEPGLLPLLVCFACFCRIVRILLCVLFLYVLHWHANKLFHFPRFKVLCPLWYIYYFSNFSRDTSCDYVRPIKTLLHVNQGGSYFLAIICQFRDKLSNL